MAHSRLWVNQSKTVCYLVKPTSLQFFSSKRRLSMTAPLKLLGKKTSFNLALQFDKRGFISYGLSVNSATVYLFFYKNNLFFQPTPRLLEFPLCSDQPGLSLLLFPPHPYSLDRLLSGSNKNKTTKKNITLVLVSLRCLPVRLIVLKCCCFVLQALHGPAGRFASERLWCRDLSESLLLV